MSAAIGAVLVNGARHELPFYRQWRRQDSAPAELQSPLASEIRRCGDAIRKAKIEVE